MVHYANFFPIFVVKKQIGGFFKSTDLCFLWEVQDF